MVVARSQSGSLSGRPMMLSISGSHLGSYPSVRSRAWEMLLRLLAAPLLTIAMALAEVLRESERLAIERIFESHCLALMIM